MSRCGTGSPGSTQPSSASGLTAEDADALMGGLLDFADQPRTAAECQVYRRYHHWWAKLPDAEMRLLSG